LRGTEAIMNRESSVLITGGAGSLGAKLALMISRTRRSVRVFDLPGLDYTPLVEEPGIEVFHGDITDRASVRQAAIDVDTVIHLAALLPPAAEEDWARTESINVGGTGSLLKVLQEQNGKTHFIFSSSVAVYGDTSGEDKPLSTEREPKPSDSYSRSKAIAEKLVAGSGLPYTMLRISGIAIPAFLEPPPVWPFKKEQRMEFVCRDDVVTALFNCVGNGSAHDRVFNIAGGETWQMSGYRYVEALYNLMGVSSEEAEYMDSPGWFDWYDTADSQEVLNYQNTTFHSFLGKVEQDLKKLLG